MSSPSSSARPSFRQDINSLRAWAVLLVVLYHFGIPGFRAGFIGVDVFFVISGFLMTSIITRNLSTTPVGKRFSIFSFYRARADRIIPSLLFLCAVLFVLGWVLLSPFDYRKLANHAIASVLFVSNIVYNREAGYFDSSSHEKLLLHTWSLAVEWQFYLLLPLLLVGVWKLSKSKAALAAGLMFVFIGSLGASILITPLAPSSAFYLLPTRAWEMILGGLLIFLPASLAQRAQTRLIESAGYVLILSSLFLFSADSLWPAWRALVPTVGTALVILANQSNSILHLGKIGNLTGLASYSIYLWHWPFASALHYLGFSQRTDAILVALAATTLASFAAHFLVENPSRKYLAKLSLRRAYSWVVFASAVVLIFALSVQQNGFKNRVSAEVNLILQQRNDRNPLMKKCHHSNTEAVPECQYGGPVPGAIVVGDSHASSLVRAVENALPSKELHVLDWTMSSCPTIANIQSQNTVNFQCGSFIASLDQKLNSIPAHVPLLVVNRFSAYFVGPNELGRTAEVEHPDLYLSQPYRTRTAAYIEEIKTGYIKTLCSLAKNRPVFVLEPTPEFIHEVPLRLARLKMLGINAAVSVPMADYLERNRHTFDLFSKLQNNCKIEILPVRSTLCSETICQSDKDGIPSYYDDDHLTLAGANLLVPELKKMFRSSRP